jgi:hypothetical protein
MKTRKTYDLLRTGSAFFDRLIQRKEEIINNPYRKQFKKDNSLLEKIKDLEDVYSRPNLKQGLSNAMSIMNSLLV